MSQTVEFLRERVAILEDVAERYKGGSLTYGKGVWAGRLQEARTALEKAIRLERREKRHNLPYRGVSTSARSNKGG